MTWGAKCRALQAHCEGAFGDEEALLYTPKSGASYSIQGIWYDEHVLADPTVSPAVSSGGPQLHVRRAAMQAEPVRGDQVARAGVTYRVEDPQPDGQGMVVLILKVIA